MNSLWFFRHAKRSVSKKQIFLGLLLLPCLFFVLFPSYQLKAQAPEIEWEKNFGGESVDNAYDIKQTKDGGYIVVGKFTNPEPTGESILVIKLNKNGEPEWDNTYYGSNSYSISQTNDNGYILVANSPKIHQIPYAFKIDQNGNILWESYPSLEPKILIQETTEIIETKNNNYVVVGSGSKGGVDYTLSVTKLSSNGAVIWHKNLGGSKYEIANSIAQTEDGGFIIAGYSESNDGDVSGNYGLQDYWVVKLDNDGVIEWEKNLGGSHSDIANDVIQTQDGGYLVIGETYSDDIDVSAPQPEIHMNSYYWIVKLNNSGSIEWEKTYQGVTPKKVQQTSGGNYIIAGNASEIYPSIAIDEIKGGVFIWIIEIDQKGNMVWQKSLGGSEVERAYSLELTNDGGMIVAGYASSSDMDVSGNNGSTDFWVVKLSGAGSGTNNLSASINSNTTTISEGEQVSFTDASNGDIISWYWTFEGGTPTSSSEENPTVTYQTAGSYDVTLEVSDGESSDSITLSDYITVEKKNASSTPTLVWDFEEQTLENFQAQHSPDFDVGGSITVTSEQVYEGNYSVKLSAETSYRLVQMINYSSLNILEEGGTFVYRYYIPSDHMDEMQGTQPFIMHGNTWTWKSNTQVIDNIEANTWYTVTLEVPAPNDGYYQAFGIELMGSERKATATPEMYVDYVEYYAPGEYTPTNNEKQPEVVDLFSLSQNYPNPFNPTTVISYQLKETSRISLKVFDMLGREVKVVASGRKAAGNYSVTFDASGLSSGIYLYRLEANGFIQTQKMVLMK